MLHTHAFQLVAEVIESKKKPSLPFGNIRSFKDHGLRQRAIIALGRQDVLVSGLQSISQLEILGSSSDYIILNSENHNLRVGDEVNFDLDYGALLAAMASPFIKKQFVNRNDHAANKYP